MERDIRKKAQKQAVMAFPRVAEFIEPKPIGPPPEYSDLSPKGAWWATSPESEDPGWQPTEVAAWDLEILIGRLADAGLNIQITLPSSAVRISASKVKVWMEGRESLCYFYWSDLMAWAVLRAADDVLRGEE